MSYNNYKVAGNWKQYPQKRTFAPYNSGYGRSTSGGSGIKKSGAVYSRIKKGKNEGHQAVNAWRKTRNGLMTASAMPVDGVLHSDKKGNEYLRYVVTVVHQGFGTTQTYWSLMNVKKQTITISELGLVISPNGSGRTGSGRNVRGYFGKFSRR
ncbi:hypothetical protein [Elizabethkingia miricola]|uniref:hypothetical protein n=1 Tax=Elizabethkingia miricola TaxID=172045 RepID=UPI0009990757|nr:hypothetical protein [Elizabethkingia miricola]OPC37699.1 hypothetical protein BAX99_16580 [Elizabethkingia miricola]